MACSGVRERELSAQGWTRRSLVTQPRLNEIAAEYRALGFEVLLEPVDLGECQNSDDCTVCFDNPDLAGQFKVVYTRRKPGEQ